MMESNNKKIAFFDSGVGGLSVLKEAIKKMPNESYIYFGDSDNAPYGTKSKEEITKLVFDAVDFLVKKNIKALVLACNTATSVAVKELREKYDFPIIGMEPAVKLAVAESRQQRIVVCATDLTLKEEKLNKLVSNLNAEKKVEYLSLQNLVLYAEKFELDSSEIDDYLEKKLSQFNWKESDTIVLGCTHFIYYKKSIQKFLPNHVQIIDGNIGTVNNLMTKIKKNDSTEIPEIEYYLSKKILTDNSYQKYIDWLNKN